MDGVQEGSVGMLHRRVSAATMRAMLILMEMRSFHAMQKASHK